MRVLTFDFRCGATGLMLVLLAACSATQTSPEVAASETPATAHAVPRERVMQRWSTSCALCHASGVAGAPTVGDAAAWQPRLAKGRAALLRNTVEGYNRMPPLGYCMSCEADDFVAMIEFMAGLAQGELQ